MNRKLYMVDAKGAAVRVAEMHKVRKTLRARKPLGPSKVPADRPVLPGEADLVPNRLYPSSGRSKVRYYLPLYRVALDRGKPQVELRYRPGGDGEVGRLTIQLTWKPPPRGNRPGQLRVMDHTTDLELRYKVPVQGEGRAAGEEVVPLQPLQEPQGQKATSVTIFTEKAQFDAVYQAMRDAKRRPTLHLQHQASVGVRTWRQVLVGKTQKGKQLATLTRSGTLMTSMLSAETLKAIGRVSTGTRSKRVAIKKPSAEETARLKAVNRMVAQPQMLHRMALAARLRPTAVTAVQPRGRTGASAARPARPVPRGAAQPRVRVRPRTTARPRGAARPAGGARRRVTVRPRVAAQPRVAVRPRVVAQPLVVAQPMVLAQPLVVQPRVPVARAVRARTIKPATARIVASTLARANAPALKVAVRGSDLKVGNKKVVPPNLRLDRKGRPAIVDTDLECAKVLPFRFDPRQHGHVYAGDFVSGGIHLLLPRTLTDESGRINRIVFQDNLMPDVIHVAPTEFRLARSAEAPFLPGLSMLCADFVTTEDDEDAEVLFNVAVSYELEPWLDPETIELARAELANEGLVARFTPIVPREAKLTLGLDLLGDEKHRAEASVEAAVGIADTLILDNNAFTRFWRERLARQSSGVTGKVEYVLFDGTAAQSQVSISLWETSPDVFDVEYIGAVAERPGHQRVRVRNRIESAATITRLPAEVVVEGVKATATDAASLVGRTLRPRETVEIDYAITPPDATVEVLEPLVFGRVEPDLNALLKLFMLNSGYSSLSFALEVKAAEGAFGPPAAGEEPLTALLVEFDDGTEAEITPDAPDTEVTLVGRLIDQILGTADDQQRYFYRVTNIHPSGEGARTSWKEGQGSTPLQVGTAVVQLDF